MRFRLVELEDVLKRSGEERRLLRHGDIVAVEKWTDLQHISRNLHCDERQELENGHTDKFLSFGFAKCLNRYEDGTHVSTEKTHAVILSTHNNLDVDFGEAISGAEEYLREIEEDDEVEEEADEE